MFKVFSEKAHQVCSETLFDCEFNMLIGSSFLSGFHVLLTGWVKVVGVFPDS